MSDMRLNCSSLCAERDRELVNTIYGNLAPLIKERKKLLITSACNGEGKTHVALNLAASFAEKQQRTVLVDADLRRSCLLLSCQADSSQNEYGLDAYLAGTCVLQSAIRETDIPNLFIMPCCKHNSNPLSLLEHPTFFELLDRLSETFDRVIIDSPSAGLYMDAPRIAAHCDGAVMVARFNKTRRSDFSQACRRIEQAGCPVLGVVMNRLSFLSVSARRYYSLLYRTFKSR